MHSLSRLVIAAALACGAGAAMAHNLWMKPSATVLSKADWVTVDAAVSNDIFFFNHRPLAVDKLTITRRMAARWRREPATRGSCAACLT